MTLDAAHKIDAGDEARVEISLIKFYAARVLHDVIDRAIQVHGALGVTDDTPLEQMYVHGARRAASTTARTRCTAWSSRGGSSRSSRKAGRGGSGEPAGDAGGAAGRRAAGVRLRARRERRCRSRARARCSSAPLRLRRPVPARAHERGALVREAARARRRHHLASRRRGRRESNDPRFAPGDPVVGQLGWQDYAVARGGIAARRSTGARRRSRRTCTCSARPVSPPTSASLDVGRPRPGDTVVVSGAAGAVGQIAGQLAKIAGCRDGRHRGRRRRKPTIFASSSATTRRSTTRARTSRAALARPARTGVDVYFDNVGGEISAAVHRRLALGARIVDLRAGLAYNAERPRTRLPPAPADRLPRTDGGVPGQRLRASLRRGGAATRRLADRRQAPLQRDVTEGLENAPQAFIGMLQGENRGKALVKVRGS